MLDKKQIANLLPHREPMLLIDELQDIEKLSYLSPVELTKNPPSPLTPSVIKHPTP